MARSLFRQEQKLFVHELAQGGCGLQNRAGMKDREGSVFVRANS